MWIDDTNDPVAMYLREFADVPPLTEDDERALFQELGQAGKWNAQQENAARQLIESQQQAVVNIAEKFSSSGVPIIELIQVGNFGLMKAVERFAEQPTGVFRLFAATCIEDAITTRLAQLNS